MSQSLVLDSFAIIAHFRQEKSGAEVKAVLLDAQQGKTQLFLSYINLAEIYYRTIREQGRQKGEEVIAAIRKLPIELISATDERVFKAAEIKAEYPIALGDCFAAALAIDQKAPILTGDPEFKKLAKLVKIRWLWSHCRHQIWPNLESKAGYPAAGD